VLLAEAGMLYYFLVMLPEKPAPPIPIRPVVRVEGEDMPTFSVSSGGVEALRLALQRQQEYLRTAGAKKRTFALGEEQVPARRIEKSGTLLLTTLQEAETEEELNRLIRDRFIVYRAGGAGDDGRVLFTSYYTPVCRGSRTPNDAFAYPLYLRPQSLRTLDLGRFDPALKGRSIVYRIADNGQEAVPYWNHEDIVRQGVLENQNLELVYLSNRIDRLVAMREGAVKVILEDGGVLWAQYAAKNGRPFRSLGRMLIDEGRISPHEASIASIREYFRSRPELLDSYLFRNESFVFFTEGGETEGALGAMGCELTPHVSIAVDRYLFPLGAPAFITYPVFAGRKPQRERDGDRTARFVVCQDTGGMIRGPGRVDLYVGEAAVGSTAPDQLHHHGAMYILLAR